MIHLLVTKTHADGKVEVETDRKFYISKSVFYKRAKRRIPLYFSGPAAYQLQKEGEVNFRHDDGSIVKIEVREMADDALQS